MAKLSGVSVATVSYVLNGKESQSISAETKQRVAAAVSELGYVRNPVGTALRRGHSNVVLVVFDPSFVGDVSERWNGAVIGALSDLGYTVVTHTLRQEAEAVKVVRSLQPFGVALFAFVTVRTQEEMRAAGARHVFGFPAVEADPDSADRPWERAIGRAQVAHLAERGYERVRYAFPEPSTRRVVAEHRLRGVREECRRQGMPQPEVFTLPLDRPRAVAALSALGPMPGSAICAADDRHALAVLAAASDLGRPVPSDVAVIGAEDTVEGRLAIPALTSARLADSGEVTGLRVWLEAELNGDRTPLGRAIWEGAASAEVVVRQST
ncbi:LacI family DNA-binding transcriptional regulator [Streptomyces sp. MBT62]|uniref:LacI family DNA-binding transcriptional regulator n=1 Tax=Streptomyces sp. MBT62 TaxID=2800410 RepID=UPI00190B1B7E|nr:LacI family DNA-binding transcriptional regulator [Streptomyces sp. MBT62]MBK3563614.1 LacI family DNA-binding transcriptional regulator [Streptomyces sp. MBT62]